MNSKAISIIIPCFNSEATISKCIGPIISQLSAGDEILVINDGSTDNTLEIAGSFPVTVIELKNNLGPSNARNRGVDTAKNSILLFIDSDVELRGGELNQTREYFEKNPNVDAITGKLNSRKRSCNFFSDYKNLYMGHIFDQCGKVVNFMYGSFCAIRKSSYIPWPENPRLGEDSHWGYLLTKNGKTIHLLKEISVIHLKKYDLISLAQNDFRIALNFTILFLKYKRWKTLYTNEKFGHTAKNQKISLILAVLTVLLSAFNPSLAAMVLFIWFMLNLSFFISLSDKRGFNFMVKSCLWTFADHLIYSAGILRGLMHARSAG